MREDDLEISTKGRKFIPIEQIDLIIDKAGMASTSAYFTIGVIVECSKPIKSKNGKLFSIIKVSDLVKYDIIKVKQQLEAHY